MKEGDLEPIDLKRCQCIRANGTFMTLGPVKRWRCKNKAYWLVVENEIHPGENVRGRMTLCMGCGKEFIKQKGSDYAKLTKIKS